MTTFSSLSDVRAEIDEVDAQLVALLKRRFAAIAAAPQFKAGPHEARIDSRVDEVEANVRRVAEEVGFDPDRAGRIWQFMMDECIEFEGEILSSDVR